jgi:hypothetical protein
MPARKANELTDLIKKLRTIRRQHEVALDEIENAFRNFGIEHLLESSVARKRGAAASAGKTKAKAKPGPKPKAAGKGKAKTKTKGKTAKAAKVAVKAKGKPGPKPKKGRAAKASKGKAAAAKAERRTRGKYTQTGDEFILTFLAKKGSATTNEIRQHWKKQGRRGKAENNLTGLVKSGKLTRTPTPGQAGSTYALPSSSAPSA